MTRVSPTKHPDHRKINAPPSNKDHDISLALSTHEDITSSPSSKSLSNKDNHPLKSVHLHDKGSNFSYIKLHRKMLRRIWQPDVFIMGIPFNPLTVIRFIQIAIVILATSILPWTNLREIMHESTPSWSMIPALGIHCLLFVVEESILYEFPGCRSGMQLGFAFLISLLYAVCEVYVSLLFSILYFNELLTILAVLVGSVIFLYGHWYWRVRPMIYESGQIVKFNEITRPEKIDERLSVGPQLVFPVPEEYAMPGVSEVGDGPMPRVFEKYNG